MANTNIEITQQLLDRHQPGKDAKTVLANMKLWPLGSALPDAVLLADLLYDGFAQTNLSPGPQTQKIDIKNPSFLLKEVLYRYLNDVLGAEFITQSRALFGQAKSYRQLSSNLVSDMRSIERDKGFQSLHKDGTNALEKHDQLLRDIYVMGDSNRVLRDSLGPKVRALYHGDNAPDLTALGASGKRRENPFKIPMLEDIKNRLEESQAAVEQMSNQELSVRLLRSFGDASVVSYDVEHPVYGVPTIYAYAPIVIDRLLNGWSFDNKASMERLSHEMTGAMSELRAIKNRFDRLQTSLQP